MKSQNRIHVEKGRKPLKAILLRTLTFKDKTTGDIEVINQSYLIKELKRRGINSVNKKVDGSETVNPVEWINKKRGTKKLNAIYLLLFIEIIVDQIFDDENSSPFREIFLRRKYIESLIRGSKHGSLNIILDIFIKLKIIERGKSYLSKGSISKSQKHYVSAFPKSIKIHKRWENFEPWYEADSNRTNKEVDTREVINFDKFHNTKNEDKRTPPPKHPWLREVIEENISKLNIIDGAHNLFNEIRECEGRKPQKSSVVKTHESFGALSIRNSPTKQAQGQVRAGYSKATGRLFHTLSMFPKDCRFMWRYKGHPVYQVDVKSAHVFLLVSLYEKAIEYKEKIWPQYTDKQYESTVRSLKNEKRRYKKRFNYKSDFYLTVAKLANNSQGLENEEEFRKKIKEGFYEFAFGEPDSELLLAKIYSKNFPILLRAMNYFKTRWWMNDDQDKYGAVIERIKEKMPDDNRKAKSAWEKAGKNPNYFKPKKWNEVPHKQLAYEMQMIEGDIMINGVCAELARWKPEKPQDPKTIWFIPNHDAIWTSQNALRVVKRVMRKHWGKSIGEIPAWDAKPFEKVENLNKEYKVSFLLKGGSAKRHLVIQTKPEV